MENASKALIMAAEILIGIMIISICVYMFNMFAQYSEDNYKKIESRQLAEFNNRFLKFEGTRITETGEIVPVECTIHDIVSLANFAQKNNIDYDLQDEEGYKPNTLYVQIDIYGECNNIEKKCNEDLITLIKKYDLKDVATGVKEIQYFSCICEINQNTGKVNHVIFKPFST